MNSETQDRPLSNGSTPSGLAISAAQIDSWTFLNGLLVQAEESLSNQPLGTAVGELSLLVKALHTVEQRYLAPSAAGVMAAGLPHHKAFILGLLSDIAQVQLRLFCEPLIGAHSEIAATLKRCEDDLFESLRLFHEKRYQTGIADEPPTVPGCAERADPAELSPSK